MLIERINAFVWGVPALALMLGAGVYLTARTRWVQLRLLGAGLREMAASLRDDGKKEGETSAFRALCTALAATVGTGNIAGVAGAIAIGGPGAVFWMWISGFVGMATKFAEAVLAVVYSGQNRAGERVGGPMYYIRKGLPKPFHFLACVYAFFGIIAALGVGNATQVNAVVTAVDAAAKDFGITLGPGLGIGVGIAMALLIRKMVGGGAPKIGAAAELLVPFASVVYVLLCLGVLAMRFDALGQTLKTIVSGAFCPRAVTGGVVGSVFTAMRIGVSRGVFSNEAGMGTAAMAHGSAHVDRPVKQGMMGIVEVFLDTIVICTMTALVILVSGVPIPYGRTAGAELTSAALSSCYGSWVSVLLSLCLCCFGLATILGWGLYAGRCVEFLFGSVRWESFAALQSGVVLLGALLETGVIWSFAEAVNGLMAVPNLIALLMLSGTAAKHAKK